MTKWARIILATGIVILVACYSLVFYTLFEYSFFKGECEEWAQKTVMLPSGKILIPSQIPVCKKWKLKEDQEH